MINLDAFVALTDPFDRLVSELEMERHGYNFSSSARRLIDAAAADLYWEARLAERHLGALAKIANEHLKLQRIAIIGRLDGRWFAACCLVDRHGIMEELLWLRNCDSQPIARAAFWSAR